MNKRMIILLLIFVSLQAHAIEFLDWFERVNLSIGPNAVIGGDVVDKGDEYQVQVLSYRFHYDPASDITRWPVNVGISLRIPVYYAQEFTTGLLANMGISNSLHSGVFGGYFEYYYRDGWSFLAGFGISGVYMDAPVGRMPANSTNANASISVTGSSFSGPGFVLGAKYHLYKYLFLEGGYSLLWKQHINNPRLKVGNSLVPMEDFNSIDIRTAHHIFVKIGVGM
jgi:hypothetical protein